MKQSLVLYCSTLSVKLLNYPPKVFLSGNPVHPPPLDLQIPIIGLIDRLHQKLQVLVGRQPLLLRRRLDVFRPFQDEVPDDQTQPEAEDDQEDAADAGVATVTLRGRHREDNWSELRLEIGPSAKSYFDPAGGELCGLRWVMLATRKS